MNPTALLVFSRAAVAAIRLAGDPTLSGPAFRQAQFAAVANARAAWRAARVYLPRLAVGLRVRYADPVSPAEAALTFGIVELRGDRALIRVLDWPYGRLAPVESVPIDAMVPAVDAAWDAGDHRCFGPCDHEIHTCAFS